MTKQFVVDCTTGQITEMDVPEEQLPARTPTDQLITEAVAEVNRQAERQRLRWATPGDGQAMTYLTKQYLEMVEYEAAQREGREPDLNKTLMMHDRVTILARKARRANPDAPEATLVDVYNEWSAVVFSQWYPMTTMIEAVREDVNDRLEALLAYEGDDIGEKIAEIMAGIVWPG